MATTTDGELRAERLGRFTLFVVFLCLLGGRFTLDRLGPTLPAFDLRFAGLAAAVLAYLVWQVMARPEQKRPIASVGDGLVLFVAWCWYMALAGLWAPPGAEVTANAVDFLFMLAFMLLGWATASRMPDGAGTVWRWFTIAGVIYLAAAVVAGPDAQGRFSAFGGGPNVFVRVMILAALGALFTATTTGRRRGLWLLPLFLAGAVLSGSRGGLLAFAVVLLVGGFPMLRRMSGKMFRRILLLGVLAVIAIPRLLGPETMADLHYRFIVLTFEENYSSGRDTITADTIDLFSEAPFFGVGLDGYYGLVGQYTGFAYPHNLSLAVLAEGGVVGGLLLLAVAAAFAVTLATRRPLPATALYFTLAAVYLAIAAQFSGDYYDSRLLWFFLGLAAIEARRDRGRNRPSVSRSVAGNFRPLSGESAVLGRGVQLPAERWSHH